MRPLVILPLVGLLAACTRSSPEPEPEPTDAAAARAQAELEARIAAFAPAELTADLSDLPASEREALTLIVEAAALLDPVFDRQAWAGNPALRAELAKDTSPLGEARLAYFDIMRGPWDRQRHFEPFAIDAPRPKGAGYYPGDLTRAEFEAYLEAHPKQADALQSLFTVVRRDGEALVAVPYSEAYAEWLEPAAKKLEAAAEATENASLARFLRLRAEAFRTDDYYESDKAWMDLESRVEVTIGPYEVYEDELMGAKAAFEAFVTVSDPEASADLAKFKALLPAMEAHLPVPEAVKTERGAESPIRVVDVVYTSGDARKSVQTIAFNLPNDERVRKEKGAKKVLLRNTIRTKFDRILRPIAERVMVKAQLPLLSADAFFQETLFHELSHSLGPAFVDNDGKTEVRAALGSSYAALEEGKADVMGAYNILFMIERGEFPAEFRDRLLVSYFAGLFRSVRFGIAEAHGKGAAFQLARFLEEGAARVDDEGRFEVDLEQLPKSITALVRDVCLMQHAGDRAEVDAFLDTYGKLGPEVEAALARLDGVPIDIRPVYPLAD